MTTTTNTPCGPFETAAQASAAAPFRDALRAELDTRGTDERVRAAMRGAAIRYVIDTLTAAGVELGAYDRRMIQWVATTWDHEETTVVLDWVLRARAVTPCAPAGRAADAAAGLAESVTVVHALPGIDLPGRLAGAHRGPRCGARDGRTALFMADVTCPACLEQIKAAAEPVEPVACGRCGAAFDPTDTAFDGRARYSDTLFCRGCVDQCHEADADHRCIICIA